MLDYEDWLRWRTCTRKQWLPSGMVARNWVFLLGLRYGATFDPTLTAYDCPFCDGWHVGRDKFARDGAAGARPDLGDPLRLGTGLYSTPPPVGPGSTWPPLGLPAPGSTTPDPVATVRAPAARLTSAV